MKPANALNWPLFKNTFEDWNEEPAHRWHSLPFAEDNEGNTSFAWPEMALPIRDAAKAAPGFALGMLDSLSPLEFDDHSGGGYSAGYRVPPVIDDIRSSLYRAIGESQGAYYPDSTVPIETEGIDTLNVGGIAPLGGIAAGGARAGVEAVAPRMAPRIQRHLLQLAPTNFKNEHGEILGAVDQHGNYRVDYSNVNEVSKGQGWGKQLYDQALEAAHSQGGALISDRYVSPDAQKMYARYERDGYRVDRNPYAKPLLSDGSALTTHSMPEDHRSLSGGGVFSVQPKGYDGPAVFSNPSDSTLPLLLNSLDDTAPAGIRAYHGSPHDFDKFSLDKIGTGEGAQAYGHGLYFAESEDVARSYRDANGPSAAFMKNPGFLKWMEDNGKNPQGHMYEVNIKANPEDFLDWDKPLGQQPNQARSVIDSLFEQNATPQRIREIAQSNKLGDAFQTLNFNKADPAATSKALLEAGIPGVRYLDGNSRNAGQGSYNYSVFDEDLIEILRKYANHPNASIPPLFLNSLDQNQ